MPYDTDNRSGITKNASESQKEEKPTVFPLFVLSILLIILEQSFNGMYRYTTAVQ